MNIKEKIVSILQSDATLQSLLGGTSTNKRIYPISSNALENFPCITYKKINASFRTVPDNAEDVILELHIYSKTSIKNLEDIYSRLNYLLNYYYTVADPLIKWSKKTMETDIAETDRQLFHKVVRYQLWSITG